MLQIFQYERAEPDMPNVLMSCSHVAYAQLTLIYAPCLSFMCRVTRIFRLMVS